MCIDRQLWRRLRTGTLKSQHRPSLSFTSSCGALLVERIAERTDSVGEKPGCGKGSTGQFETGQDDETGQSRVVTVSIDSRGRLLDHVNRFALFLVVSDATGRADWLWSTF
jgi:hypothetical protein